VPMWVRAGESQARRGARGVGLAAERGASASLRGAVEGGAVGGRATDLEEREQRLSERVEVRLPFRGQ